MTPHIVSLERIKLVAGARCFALGEKLLAKQTPSRFVMHDDMAKGDVAGFSVSLSYRGDSVEGSCSCPASEGFEFCEHCVCLTLFANKQGQQVLSLSKGPDKSRVLAYLLSLDKPVLAKQMLGLLEQDSAQFKRYLLKVSLDTDALDFTALKKELTTLTKPQSQMFSQRQVKHFFSRIERFLEEVKSANYLAQPEPMLKLLEYAIARVNLLLEKVEDRTGQREVAVSYLRGMFLSLFEQLSARPETLSKRFEKNWLSDQFQVLGLNIEPFFKTNPKSLALSKTRLKSAWLSRCWPKSSRPLLPWQMQKLARYFLENEAHDLSLEESQGMSLVLAQSDQDFLKIAERWSNSGRPQDAIAILDERLASGHSHPDMLIAAADIACYLPDAEARLLDLLERYPNELARPILDSINPRGFSTSFHEQVVESLLRSAIPELMSLILPDLLRFQRFPDALKLIRLAAVDADIVAECVPALIKEFPEECIQILEKKVVELLAKSMLSADVKAARLMHLLEFVTTDKRRTKSFVMRMQPTFRSRPKFVESYEQFEKKTTG